MLIFHFWHHSFCNVHNPASYFWTPPWPLFSAAVKLMRFKWTINVKFLFLFAIIDRVGLYFSSFTYCTKNFNISIFFLCCWKTSSTIFFKKSFLKAIAMSSWTKNWSSFDLCNAVLNGVIIYTFNRSWDNFVAQGHLSSVFESSDIIGLIWVANQLLIISGSFFIASSVDVLIYVNFRHWIRKCWH